MLSHEATDFDLTKQFIVYFQRQTRNPFFRWEGVGIEIILAVDIAEANVKASEICKKTGWRVDMIKEYVHKEEELKQ